MNIIDHGAWVQTYSGRCFPILHPTADDVDIEDIAHALSNLCRFAGHTKEFYSVAQHSVLVSKHVPDEFALQALLHDAPEAYIVDLPRPLKHSGMVDGYKVIEDRVWAAIAEHFFLFEDLDPRVKLADNRALFTEQRDLIGKQAKPWSDQLEPYPDTIIPMTPKEAKSQFLGRYMWLEAKRAERLLKGVQ
jgi:uncharacterized protein